MEIKQLQSVVTSILSSIGFKHWKSNLWKRSGSEISECIHLQRSLYSKLYYFRYGYIINKLPLKPSACFHTNENMNISISIYKDLQYSLNLENNLTDEERELRIRKHLLMIVPETNVVDTEKKLKKLLLDEQLPISKEIMDYLNIKCIDGVYE